MQDLRERVSELHAYTVRSIFTPHGVAALDDWADWIGETYSRVLAIEVRAKKLAPVLASEMKAVQDHVMDAFDRRPIPTEVDGDEMHAVKHNIRVITQTWLEEPNSLTPKLGPALAAARQEVDAGNGVP